jgi:asparagine synthase (glutamine-hydrolysing)
LTARGNLSTLIRGKDTEMCGIAGFFRHSGEPEAERILARMAGTMLHRGPDAGGAFISPDRKVGLCHRRLSILDLSEAGAQPMADPSEEIVLSYNGEVYNFREVREELSSLGHRFRGTSDTEVLLAAYRQWGIGCLSRFLGMFAFALWDGKAGKLFLARDRLGIKPLYYYRGGGFFLFGSELKPLLAHPSFPGDIDRSALQYYLQFMYVPGPHSIFAGCRKLAPGHVGVLSGDGHWETFPFWNVLDHWGKKGEARSGTEYEEELVGLIRSSVRYRMISDVPLGAFLSGGIDSSLVVSVMQSESSFPVQTFSIGFRERGFDESPHARRVAEYLGTDHHEEICEPAEAIPIIRQLPEFYDEPFADPSAIPTMMVSRFARRFVTVSLSGDGGDELFCGYPRYAWYRSLGLFGAIPAPVRRGVAGVLYRVPNRRAKKAAVSLSQARSIDAYRNLVGICEKERIPALLPHVVDDGTLPFYVTYDRTEDMEQLERLMAVDIRTYLPDDILAKVDRASMAYSLEARVPLLDHRIVEFAGRLPLAYKVRGQNQKFLLKRVLHRLLPRKLVDRPKMGFGVPLDRWFRDELRSLVREYLDGARIRREGYFLADGVETMVGEHLSGRRNHFMPLWAMIQFGMWKEYYKIGNAR